MEGGGPTAEQEPAFDETQPPEWATKGVCGRVYGYWNYLWSQTDIDEKFWSKQEVVSEIYLRPQSQWCVATLIFGNFICSMIEMTIDPSTTKYVQTFFYFECIFNFCFLIELLINMYAHWFWKFVRSSWNWFDLLVVTLGMLSVAGLLDGPLTMLRNMRAFRVFRLFKRVKSLNKILVALGRAVPGVSNAFAVITIVMSIYAILGVSFFREIGVNGTVVTRYASVDGYYEQEVSSLTPRGIPFGEEYFGNFGRALFTLFQLLMGDSWSEIVGRMLVWGYDPALGVLYIVSFMIFNAIILINVVVAVLLEKVIDDDDGDGELPAHKESSPQASPESEPPLPAERKSKMDRKSKGEKKRRDSEMARDSSRSWTSTRNDPSGRASGLGAPIEGLDRAVVTGASPARQSPDDVRVSMGAIGEGRWDGAGVACTLAPNGYSGHQHAPSGALGEDYTSLREEVAAMRAELRMVMPAITELKSEIASMRAEVRGEVRSVQ